MLRSIWSAEFWSQLTLRAIRPSGGTMFKRLSLTLTIAFCAFAGSSVLSSAYLEAQSITAASCNAPDVQAAFNSVTSSTTTVNIPAGTCNWSSSASFTVPSGSSTITIAGATTCTGTGDPASNNLSCTDNTIIVDNYASNNSLINITANSSPTLIRVTGLTIEGGSGSVKYGGIISLNGSTNYFRFDHSHINTTTYSPSETSAGMQINGCIYGVVDHSQFDNPSGSVNNSVQEYNAGACYSDPLGVGDESWHNATQLGSANFLVVEQNIFNSGAVNDCSAGGRFVYRFNTFNMTSPPPTVQTHPTGGGGGGRIRGCRACEIYGNAFNAKSSNYINTAFWLSSGTGVVWGNTLPSSSTGGGTGYGNFILLNSMRQNNASYTQTAPPAGWGYCGTAFNGTGSAWDQNAILALIALFQGAVSGSATPWVKLPRALEQEFPGEVEVTIIPSGDSFIQNSQASYWIESQLAKYPKAKVVLIGHSYGGDTVAWSDIVSDLAVLIDPIQRSSASFDQSKLKLSVTVPATTIIDYYQTNGGYLCPPGFHDLKGFQVQNGSNYDESAPSFGDGPVYTDHCSIKEEITPLVIANIRDLLKHSSATGHACLDQPGRGMGDLLVGGFTSDGSGSNNVCDITVNPSGCSVYTGNWVNEALEPIYEWSDNYSPVPSNPSNLLAVNTAFNNTPNFVANTDYYLWCNASSHSGCTSFTGATGVGSGTRASRPSTCTTGVAYFSTDQGNWNTSGNGFGNGVLDECTATNTWTLFYTPYTYPHPLTQDTSPSPPTGLSAQVNSP